MPERHASFASNLISVYSASGVAILLLAMKKGQNTVLGIRDIRNSGIRGKGESKDLHRLSRQDLLELLVGQMHEGDELRAVIEQKERDIASLDELGNRLKEKLNLKDDQIEHLKEKLDLKDDQIENLKNKLNLKDVQIEHLKNKLDDKDVLIDKLKGRLDQKDVLISRLSESQSVSVDDLEVFEARVRAAEIAQADVMPQDEGSLDE